MHSLLPLPYRENALTLHKTSFAGGVLLLPELIGSLKLGNVWVFVQLIFGPRWPMNQLNKNLSIA